jgi:protein-L-isoaspartate(D-aspartate) O-methyltransferase
MSETAARFEDEAEAIKLHELFVDKLKAEDKLPNAHIERAFRSVPRHRFLPEMPPEEVYHDVAITTKRAENGEPVSSSSQPSLMALMLAEADLQPGQHVLEIGTATGYNAALISSIVGEEGSVVSIDIDCDLVDSARLHLRDAGIPGVHVVCADGGYGHADGAPYDRIILTVGSGDIAPAWWDQLKPDGRILIPLTIRGQFQRVILFEPRDRHLESLSVTNCVFVGLRGDYEQTDQHRLPIGNIPGLVMSVSSEMHVVDGDTVSKMLSDEHIDEPVGITVGERELGTSLLEWLMTNDPGVFGLYAIGDQANSGIVPYLFGMAGRSCFSIGIADESGLALLMRSPSVPLPSAPGPGQEHIELWIRAHGNHRLAEELNRRIIEWSDRGRPDDSTMKVHAYRAGDPAVPAGNGLRIDKKFSTLVIEWCASHVVADIPGVGRTTS